MRNIKFRFWNKAGKFSRMFYDTENVMECLKQQMLFNDNPLNKLGFSHIAEGCSFMQYTGLKDKNSRDVYEGDIMTDGLVVVFEYGGFCFENNEHNSGSDRLHPNRVSRLEVIGNIYETP